MTKGRVTCVAHWVIAGFVASMVLLQATSATAAWSAAAGATSGTLTMATLAYTFTPIKNGALLGSASGTGGSSYTSTSTGVGATDYFDIQSNSSVTVNPSVTITPNFSQSLTLFPTISIYSCATAWNTTLGTCSSGATSIASYSASTTPSYSWGSMNNSDTLHMEVVMGGALGNVSLNATVGSSGVRAGMDRTAG